MANQIIIDIGAVANDGTGDPLRTAFGYVNNNFSNIWATGVANSNISFSGNKILTTNTNGNLVLAPNGVGKVQSNVDIVPNANNTLSLGSLTNKWNTVYAQNLNVGGNVSFADVTVNGNLTVNGTTTTINTANVDIEDKMITLAFGSSTANLANGAGINVAGANANITYLSSGDRWQLNKNTDVVGNLAVSSGSLTVTGPLGNVWRLNGDSIRSPLGGTWESIANTEYFSSGINGFVHLNSFDAAGNIASTIDVEHSFIQFNIYDGINAQWSMNQTGTTSFPNYTFPYADGNVNEVLVSDGNGTLSWSGSYGNANVANYLASGTNSSNIATTNNISANNINFTTNLYGKTATFTGDIRGENSIYAGVPLFTSLGSDVVAQFSGNVNAYTQFNFQNGNVGAQASGDYVITADNGNDSTHFINLGITSSIWDGTQPNSLGNRLGPNDGYLYVQDGDMVIGTSNGTIETWKFGQDGALTAPGNITTTGNISGGNVGVSGAVNAVGEITSFANLVTTGEVQAIGNISGSYILGNGSQLTGIVSSYGNSNVTTLLAAYGSNTISTTGNITGGNINTTGIMRMTHAVGAQGEMQFSDGVGSSFIVEVGTSAGTWAGAGSLNLITSSSPGGNIGVFVAQNEQARFTAGGANITGTLGVTGNITSGNVTTTGTLNATTAVLGNAATVTTSNYAIGYRDIPQVSFIGNATIATTDAGKHFYSTQSSNYTLTIANNASQGFQVGAAITVVNQGTGTITIAQGSGVTLYLAGNATSGNRSVSTFGMATIMKVATDTWFINGTGVS